MTNSKSFLVKLLEKSFIEGFHQIGFAVEVTGLGMGMLSAEVSHLVDASFLPLPLPLPPSPPLFCTPLSPSLSLSPIILHPSLPLHLPLPPYSVPLPLPLSPSPPLFCTPLPPLFCPSLLQLAYRFRLWKDCLAQVIKEKCKEEISRQTYIGNDSKDTPTLLDSRTKA